MDNLIVINVPQDGSLGSGSPMIGFNNSAPRYFVLQQGSTLVPLPVINNTEQFTVIQTLLDDDEDDDEIP